MSIYFKHPREYYGDIGKEIGRGGSGYVYELPNNLCIKYGNLFGLLNEMSIMTRFKKCKYVVCMIDMGIIGDMDAMRNNAYIIMERATSDLRTASIKDPIFVLYQIIMGFIYLLSYGILHTDMIEYNILYYGDDKIKISDLGVFKIINLCGDIISTSFMGSFISDKYNLNKMIDKTLFELIDLPVFQSYKRPNLDKFMIKCRQNKLNNMKIPNKYLLDDKRVFDMINVMEYRNRNKYIGLLFRIFVLYDYIISTRNDISRINLINHLDNICREESFPDVITLTSILNFNWHPTTPLDYADKNIDRSLLLVLYIDNPVNYDDIINRAKMPAEMVLQNLSDELREAYQKIY